MALHVVLEGHLIFVLDPSKVNDILLPLLLKLSISQINKPLLGILLHVHLQVVLANEGFDPFWLSLHF